MDATIQQMIENGNAKIAAENAADERAEQKRLADEQAEIAQVRAVVLAAARGMVPAALHPYLSTEVKNDQYAAWVHLAVPGLSPISFRADKNRYPADEAFHITVYTTAIDDDGDHYVHEGMPDRCLDLEKALAWAAIQEQERLELEADCAKKNANLAAIRALPIRPVEKQETVAVPEPTADEIFLDALHEYVRRVLDDNCPGGRCQGEHSCCG